MKATDFDATELESRELKHRAKLFRWFLSPLSPCPPKKFTYIFRPCVGWAAGALDAGGGCPAGDGYLEYASH